MPTGVPRSSLISRIIRMFREMMSYFAWEKLMRTTLSPAAMRALSVAGESLAGPRVATMRVRLLAMGTG